MRHRSNGFTLLEVLVAMTILAVALAALIKGGSDHSRNTLYLQERTLAHWAGQNVLAEYESGMRPIGTGNRTGDAVMGPFRYGYRVEITDYVPEAPVVLPAVKRIDVTLWLFERGEQEQRALVSGFMLP